MLRDQYPEYFSPSGQVKRSLSPEDKLFIRQALLDEEDRGIKILSPITRNTDKHKFGCMVCHFEWSTALGHVVSAAKSGCPRCSGKHRRTAEEYLSELAKLEPTYTFHSLEGGSNQSANIKMTCNRGHTTNTCKVANFINNAARCKKCSTDHDSIYLYELSNTGIFKVGITSSHLGMRRMNEVAKSHNCEAVMILLEKKSNVEILEATILNKYKHLLVSDMVGDGHTEMLELQPKDISEIKEIINVSQ